MCHSLQIQRMEFGTIFFTNLLFFLKLHESSNPPQVADPSPYTNINNNEIRDKLHGCVNNNEKNIKL